MNFLVPIVVGVLNVVTLLLVIVAIHQARLSAKDRREMAKAALITSLHPGLTLTLALREYVELMKQEDPVRGRDRRARADVPGRRHVAADEDEDLGSTAAAGPRGRHAVTDLTPDEHRARHAELHAMLDELVADYITETGEPSSTTTVKQLMEWSWTQVREPAGEHRLLEGVDYRTVEGLQALKRIADALPPFGKDLVRRAVEEILRLHRERDEARR